MLKLAVIFESSPFDRKGLFNAVHERIGHLLETGRCEIDAFCVNAWDTSFTRRMRHTPKVERKVEYVIEDGIRYRMLWYDFSIIDHVTVEKLHKTPYFFSRFAKKVVAELKGYDAVIAHSFTGGLIAFKAFENFGIPYFANWHGSDVHTHPWRNNLVLNTTRTIMEKAVCNFFVSNALLETSDRITEKASKDVLYNGVSPVFHRLSDTARSDLRRKYGISSEDKVVAFVGSIVAVKNVKVLQPLFHEIRARYRGQLKFWMVGDGKMRSSVEPMMTGDDSIDVRMWGNVPAAQMSSVMNSIDVLVLPSLNEGLPLVCAEAIRCGANVVGADVGGVAEVIGKEYVVPHGEGFVSVMASQVVDLLNEPVCQCVSESFDWSRTAEKEISVISSSIPLEGWK